MADSYRPSCQAPAKRGTGTHPCPERPTCLYRGIPGLVWRLCDSHARAWTAELFNRRGTIASSVLIALEDFAPYTPRGDPDHEVESCAIGGSR